MLSRKLRSKKDARLVKTTKSSPVQQELLDEQANILAPVHSIIQNNHQNAPTPQTVQRMQSLYGNAQTQRLISTQTGKKNVIQRGLDNLMKNKKKLGTTHLFYKKGMTLEEAQAIMQRLTHGDESVMDELDVCANELDKSVFDDFADFGDFEEEEEKEEKPSAEDTAKKSSKDVLQDKKVEWGLMQDPNTKEVAIFKGYLQSTDWDVFLKEGLTPLAHTHPQWKRTIKETSKSDKIKFKDVITDNKLRLLIFPSAGDIAFAAREKVTLHTVYTPYYGYKTESDVILTDTGKVKNQLRFEIIDAKLKEENMENSGYNRYEAKLSVYLGNELVVKYDQALGDDNPNINSSGAMHFEK